MDPEILKIYRNVLVQTWSTYLHYRILRAEGESARHINLGAANTEYEKAAKELQDELLFNKTHYSTTGIDNIVWLLKHMNIKWPAPIPEGFNEVKGISSALSNNLYDHVNHLREQITIEFISKKTTQPDNEEPHNKDGTYREIILAYEFKVKAGLEKPKKPAAWASEYGKDKIRQECYTIDKASKNYRAPDGKELNKVIELLEDYPSAKELALIEVQKL